MDVRDTIQKEQSFTEILWQQYHAMQPVNLLYDSNGITRGSGLIKRIFETGNVAYVELDEGPVISIHKIVAVNGMFADDYSEC